MELVMIEDILMKIITKANGKCQVGYEVQ